MAEKILVRDARNSEHIGKQVILQGWVRTRRDSKAGFSFIELNDGSSQGNIQVIADADLPNYENEIKSLTAGCSIAVTGEIKESGGKGQATEVQAAEVIVHGVADAEKYPLQKKRHSFEKLREWAHLRPLLAPSLEFETAFATRYTSFFRNRISTTSTRLSSRPATARELVRCSR